MATIVDQLLVTLELDSSKFKKGIEEARQLLVGLDKASQAADKAIHQMASAGLKSIQAQAKAAQAAVSSAAKSAGQELKASGDAGETAGNKIQGGMGRGTMGVYALIAAIYKLNKAIGFPAIYEMTEGVIKSETETLRFANSLRLNTTELQAWQKAVQLNGGDVSGFNSGLEKMEANLGKLGTKVRGAKLLEQYLGLSGITDAMVKGKDAFGVLELFSRQMRKMSVEQQFLVGRRLGLDDATIRTLQEGGDAILKQVEGLRELAASRKELEASRDAAVAQERLNLAWERAKQVLATAFIPAINNVVATLTTFTNFMNRNKEAVVAAAVGIGVALASLAAVAAVAAVGILAAGFQIATGMTLATGGAWAIGAAAGVAALTLLQEKANALSTDFDRVSAAHKSMMDELAGKNDQAAKLAQGRKLLDTYAADAVRVEGQIRKRMESVRESMAVERSAVSLIHPLAIKLEPKLEAQQAQLDEAQKEYNRIQAKLIAGYGKYAEMQKQFAAQNPEFASALSRVNAAYHADVSGGNGPTNNFERINIYVNDPGTGDKMAEAFVNKVGGYGAWGGSKAKVDQSAGGPQ